MALETPPPHNETDDLSTEFDGEPLDSIEAALMSQAPTPALWHEGTVVAGQYTLGPLIGRGGMGEVYLATHTETKAKVALKVLRDASPRMMARFDSEARNASALHSPHTVRVLDYGVDQAPYLVMEYVEGASLAEMLRNGALPWKRAVALLEQVLLALWEAHTHPRRIVHRDIKPENIMVAQLPGQPDVVRVLDFGISRALEGTHHETQGPLGSPLTMAPEQWAARPISPKTDLYSVGCTAFMMLTGQPPFDGETLTELAQKHQHEAPTFPAHTRDAVPVTIQTWVLQMMSKRPAERPESAEVALGELRWARQRYERNPGAALDTLPEQPFRHLSRFRREHAPLFFGRERAIRKIYEAITDPEGPPIVLVMGETGVGKSSLLDAGVLPRLSDWESRYARRDDSLGLDGTLAQALERHGPWLEAWCALESEMAQPVVIVLDQAEELFTQNGGPGELHRFVEGLQGLWGNTETSPRGKLVLSFRKEWLAEMNAALSGHGALPTTSIRVEPLSRFEIVEVVEALTSSLRLREHYPLSIEQGLPQAIADDLLSAPDAAVAPTLQILLTRLWDEAPLSEGARRWDRALYDRLKQDGIFLDDFVEEQIAVLAAWDPTIVESGLLLDLLAHHTTPLGTAATCQASTLAMAYPHHRQRLVPLIRRCEDAYLLRGRVREEGDTLRGSTQLAHDTLAPIVRNRYERSSHPGQRAKRLLQQRSLEWSSETDKPSPFDNSDLSIVEAGQSGMRAWTPAERQLVDASRAKRHRHRWQIRALGVAGVLLVIAIAVAALLARDNAIEARASETEARRLLHISQTRNLIDSAEERFGNQRALAALLAVQAWRRHSREPAPAALMDIDAVVRQSLGSFALPAAFTGHTDTVFSASFSPDGRLLATASADKTVRIWQSRDPLAPPRVFEGHTRQVVTLAYSPDGTRVVSGGPDGTARIWTVDAKDGDPVILHVGKPVLRVAWGPGDRIAATVHGGRALLWDAKSPQREPREITAGHKALIGIDFDRTGTKLAIGAFDGKALLFDLEAPESPPRAFAGHKGPVLDVALHPNGEHLFTAGNDGTLRQWSLNNPEAEPHTRVTGEKETASVSISPNGRFVAAGNRDWSVLVWDLSNPDRAPTALDGHFRHTLSVAFSPDGRRLVAASDADEARVWDLTATDPLVLPGKHKDITRLSITADGRFIASSGKDGALKLWDTHKETVPQVLQHRTADAPRVFQGAVAMSQDGAFVFGGELGGRITAWETGTDAPPTVLKSLQASRVNSMAFSPAGTLLVATARESGLEAWRWPQQGDPIIHKPFEIGHRVVFDATGKRFAATGDNILAVFDAEAPETPPRLLQTEEGLFGAAFSPDGKWLAAGGSPKTLYIFDMHDLDAPPRTLQGHNKAIFSLAFTPDSRWLYSGSFDNTIRVWDVQRDFAFDRSHKSTGHPVDIIVDPSGPHVYSSAGDHIRRWTPLDTLIPILCARIWRNLTALEWRTYLGDTPYETTCPNLPPHPSTQSEP